jgi:hypothetical protein
MRSLVFIAALVFLLMPRELAGAENGEAALSDHSPVTHVAARTFSRRPGMSLYSACYYYSKCAGRCATCNFWGKCYCSSCCVAIQSRRT